MKAVCLPCFLVLLHFYTARIVFWKRTPHQLNERGWREGRIPRFFQLPKSEQVDELNIEIERHQNTILAVKHISKNKIQRSEYYLSKTCFHFAASSKLQNGNSNWRLIVPSFNELNNNDSSLKKDTICGYSHACMIGMHSQY